MSRCKDDICDLLEVRWRGASARLKEGKDSRYKMFWARNDNNIFYKNLKWALTKIGVISNVRPISLPQTHLHSLTLEKNTDGYEGAYAVRGFGRHNLEGERVVESVLAHNLVVSNSLFTKRGSQRVTYQSCEN